MTHSSVSVVPPTLGDHGYQADAENDSRKKASVVSKISKKTRKQKKKHVVHVSVAQKPQNTLLDAIISLMSRKSSDASVESSPSLPNRMRARAKHKHTSIKFDNDDSPVVERVGATQSRLSRETILGGLVSLSGFKFQV